MLQSTRQSLSLLRLLSSSVVSICTHGASLSPFITVAGSFVQFIVYWNVTIKQQIASTTFTLTWSVPSKSICIRRYGTPRPKPANDFTTNDKIWCVSVGNNNKTERHDKIHKFGSEYAKWAKWREKRKKVGPNLTYEDELLDQRNWYEPCGLFVMCKWG